MTFIFFHRVKHIGNWDKVQSVLFCKIKNIDGWNKDKKVLLFCKIKHIGNMNKGKAHNFQLIFTLNFYQSHFLFIKLQNKPINND